ncbi:MAG: hypothetical protein AB1847_20210 [bacterium]
MPVPKTPKIITSLAAVGFSCVVTQVILIREGITTFGGNELIIGLILGIWLLSTASGASLGVFLVGREKAGRLLFCGHLLLAVIPFLQLAGFRVLPLLWIRGELPGIGSALIGSSLILFPYGLISGAMIPAAASLLSPDRYNGGHNKGHTALFHDSAACNSSFRDNPFHDSLCRDTPSTVYIIDLWGEVLGGVLFSFLFVYLFSHWGVLIALGSVHLMVAVLLSSPCLWPVPVLLALFICFSAPLNMATLTFRTPGQKILFHKNTPFAQLAITRSGKQINVLSDGIPLFSTGDYRAEALGHIPLVQVGAGARVLLISGGVFGTLSEILRHKPNWIDYVELDPAILSLGKKICTALDAPCVHTHVGDGRLFMKKARQKRIHYDCLILNLPDPENIQLNRFYTREFFQEARDILNPQGVLFFTLTGADNYLESEGLGLNRSVYAALTQVFPHVILFPGETHYFLASRKPLLGKEHNPGLEIRKKLAELDIRTRWLTDYQLSEMTDSFRMDRIGSLVAEKDALPNTDLSPLAFRHLLNLWLKKSGGMGWMVLAVVIVLAALFAFLACRQDSLLLVTFSSGYAGMCLELSLLLLFQIIFGYVYLWISLFVTLFMIGLGAGALAARKWRQDPLRQTGFQDVMLILLACLVLGLAVFSRRFHAEAFLSIIQCGIIPFLIFGSGLAVGWQFVAISHQFAGQAGRITGGLYLADLAGASCGTLLTSLFLLPQFGISGVLLSAALVKSASLAVVTRMRKAR